MGIVRGGNLGGHKWNRGGSKRRKNYITIDWMAFAAYAEKLDRLGADMQKILTESMEKAGTKVQADVRDAVAKPNLPAKGEYSNGDTERSILEAKVLWHGSLGEMNLGFDKSVSGAGGFLITGTPKMAPDYALAQIFTQKSYEKNIKDEIKKDLQREIDRIMGR